MVKVKKQRDECGPSALFPVCVGRIVDLGLLEAGDSKQVISLPFWQIVLNEDNHQCVISVVSVRSRYLHEIRTIHLFSAWCGVACNLGGGSRRL